MKKQILLPRAVLRELRETFKVHQVVLDRALKYERNSRRDNMLRKAALQRGGVIYLGIKAPTNYLPDVETTFNTGYMRQKFGSDIEVILDLNSNKAIIEIYKQPVASFSDCTVETWGNMLYSLQQIYNKLNSLHPASTAEAKPIEAEVRTTSQQ